MSEIEKCFFERQKDKIKKLLYIASESPYYSNIFSKNAIHISNLEYEDFKRIPILTKGKYREYQFEMITTDVGLDVAFVKRLGDDYFSKKNYLQSYGINFKFTSGSTGFPLEILKLDSDLKKEYFYLNLRRKKIFPNIAKKSSFGFGQLVKRL